MDSSAESTSSMSTYPIDEATLKAVYASDQEMYPAPLPYERLQAWVESSGGLSMCFKNPTDPAQGLIGVIITLPVKETYWRRLLRGEIKEMEIVPESMLASLLQGNATQKVGLHVSHVERFTESEPGVRGGFAATALDEVLGRARLRTDWEVVGLSALTATPAGKKTFQRLGFEPTGYRETFIQRATEGDSAASMEGAIEMICTYPGDEMETHIESSCIVSASEMAVRYCYP
ncbi:hypothetical protein QBC47DRAFT_414419 [Echria macrotheca]|uniref:Uncharacterized protein n=1 Tax=Echria macrotheca TaxID=438768 RepID=A0AAJ0FAN9_9PEZI|nr:hypothetical protein QBC47DRAFT_414419 [Echria macrotheca]